MKKTVILAVALLVAGCGGSGGTQQTTSPPPPPPPPAPTQIVSGPFYVGSAFSQPNPNTSSPIPWNIISNTFPVVADMQGGRCGLLGEPPCISNYLMLTNLRNSSLRLDLPIDEIEVDANLDSIGSGTINLSIVIQLTADGNYDPNAAGAAFGVGQLPQKFVARRTLADWAKPGLTPAQAATANFGLGLLTGFPDPSSELEVHNIQVTFYQHVNP